MDRKGLQAKMESAYANAKAITAGAKAQKRDLNDEEAKAVDALLAEGDGAKAELEAFDAAEKRAARLKAIDSAQPRRGSAEQASTETQTVNQAAITSVKARFEEDPKKGFKTARAFLAAVLNVDTGRASNNTSEQNAALRGQFRTGKGEMLAAAGADEQGTHADPYGGYLIPEGFSPSMLQLNPEADPTEGRTLNIPMASPTVKIPARVDKNHTSSVSGGLRVYRRAETDTTSSSRQEYELVSLQANTLMGLNYTTEELLSDSPISVAALLQAGFASEFRAKILKEKLFGTGVGEYEGVMNCAGRVDVSKETGQAAATINTQNVLKMRARCYGYGNAVWLANHDTFPQLMQLTLAVGTGGSAVSLFDIRSDDGINRLLGRPIFFTEFCKTVGTTGDLILGDWSQYLEGTYQSAQSAESIHVRFVNHERTFKFWMRNDGRNWWRSTLTVNQGSNSLAPFVALNTRA